MALLWCSVCSFFLSVEATIMTEMKYKYTTYSYINTTYITTIYEIDTWRLLDKDIRSLILYTTTWCTNTRYTRRGTIHLYTLYIFYVVRVENDDIYDTNLPGKNITSWHCRTLTTFFNNTTLLNDDGVLCENKKDWCEFISHPWRGCSQPQLAKRACFHHHHHHPNAKEEA